MIKVLRFENQLMSSYCYLVLDEVYRRCVIIDPGSEKSEKEIKFIDDNNYTLDYIFLTHEHTDHTWGVNSLVAHYPSVKVVCSTACRNDLPGEVRLFFQLYYDDPGYAYDLCRVDNTTENLNWHLSWAEHSVFFFPTPGHTPGSICIAIEGVIFGGDTLLQYKPYIRKRNGGSLSQFEESVKSLLAVFPEQTLIYPGHGESFTLRDYNYKRKI